MTRSRTIAVAQTCPVPGDVQADVHEHLRLARLAAGEGAQTVVFPWFAAGLVTRIVRSGHCTARYCRFARRPRKDSAKSPFSSHRIRVRSRLPARTVGICPMTRIFP